jgi:hypothetical protein
MNNTVATMLLNEQSKQLLSLRGRLEEKEVRVSADAGYQFERAKMIGMLDMARAFDMNIDEYRWVYAC